jgi:dTDP-glucose 4,6-dehydratase
MPSRQRCTPYLVTPPRGEPNRLSPTRCGGVFQERPPERLIPHIIIRGLAEEPLPLYGDGQNVRDWVYVEDHARALALVVQRGAAGETYNIGARTERANVDVVKSICRLLDEMQPSSRGPRERLITFVPDRPGHDRRYAIHPSKIERELGWRAEHDFETGLEKTVRWYLDHQGWWRAILKRGYATKRVGLGRVKLNRDPAPI